MGYSLDDMIRDSGASREQIKAGVQAMDEEARAYRLRETQRAQNERKSEAAVRSACVDLLGVKDSYYTEQEIKAFGAADGKAAETIADELRETSGTGLIDRCERLMQEIRPPKTRHDTGTVYTPQNVVEMMVANASPGEFECVVDVGCGCGRFAYTTKLAAGNTKVIGIDLDPLACLLAATVSTLEGVPFEVIRGDFLKKNIKTTGRTLYIGNPPYVRHHMLAEEQKTQGHAMAEQLKLKGWSGLAGLYALFIERILCRARQGDRMMIVTGAEWLDAGYGKPLRDAFASTVGGGSALTYYPASMDLFNGAMSTALVSRWEIGENIESVRCAVDGGERFHEKTGKLATLDKWGSVFAGGNKPPSGMKTIALGDLFRISRGIVTGNNKYFVLPADDRQAKAMGDRAVPVVARAADIPRSAVVEPGTLKKRLLLLDGQKDAGYISIGEKTGVREGFIASCRTPWYAIKPKPAPILATYMRRGRPRFALNPGRCPNLNTVHGLYPKTDISEETMRRVVAYLNNGELYGDTGRVYQGGLIKYEPKEMERIEIPCDVIEETESHDA